MSTQHCSRPPHPPYRLVVNRHRSHLGLGLIALRRSGPLAVGVPVLVVRAVCGLVGGGMTNFTTRVPAFELAWAVGRMDIGKLLKSTRISFGSTHAAPCWVSQFLVQIGFL
ncbi:hypothetical protein Plhal304r1_c046g0127741 [Plasmopara halstedii]